MSKSIEKQNKRYGLLFCIFFTSLIFSQEATKSRSFSGATTITNNGISLLPTFSLGKPAAIFDFSIKGKKWSFDPQLRFSLEGKPWSFIFWGRYKAVNDSRFKLSFGAHPAIAFKQEKIQLLNGDFKTIMNAYRYTATEIAPSFTLSKNCSIGMYYLYSHGWDPGTTLNTHFITLNSTISNLKLVKGIDLKVQPQLYYLKMDSKEGYYFSSTMTLSTPLIPLTLSSIVNKAIATSISGKDSIWNLSLSYSY